MRFCVLCLPALLLVAAPLRADDSVRQVELQVSVLSLPGAAANSPEITSLQAKCKPGIPEGVRYAAVSAEAAARLLRQCRAMDGVQLLGEPRICALSGRPGQFVAGGRQAILSTSGEPGGPGIDFRDVGADIEFLPIVRCNGDIDLEVKLTLRSVNEARGVQTASGFVPGHDAISAHMTAELKPDCSLAALMPGEKALCLIVLTPRVFPEPTRARPQAQSRTAAVAAKLMAKYHEACARGDAEQAREFALMALDLDPACFARPAAKADVPPVPVSVPAPAAPTQVEPPTKPTRTWRLFRHGPTPNERMEALIDQSEELRQVRDEWRQFWFTDQPSRLTPDRVHGSIDP